jgi:adenosylcobinamide amidohydrolase
MSRAEETGVRAAEEAGAGAGVGVRGTAVTRAPGTLLVAFGGPRRVLSSAVLGGGIGIAHAWLNATVASDYDRLDPAVDLAERAIALGCGVPLVGMLTAVDVARCENRRRGVAQVFATVGVGHALAAAGTRPRAVPPVGTINLLVLVDAPLDDAALAGAAQTAIEAKAQALAAAAIPAANADCHATGTATDAFCIAALPGGGVPFAGPATAVGADIAHAVHGAVLAGALADRADFGASHAWSAER